MNYISRGKGFWKFNTLLSKDEKFVTKLKNKIIENIKDNEKLNLNEIWENVKLTIATVASKHSIDKAMDNKIRLTNLNKELESLIKDQCRTFSENSQRQNEIRFEIENIYETRIKGTMFRSKARWYGEGEKSNKYFDRLEKTEI